jgi:hypothetical protein
VWEDTVRYFYLKKDTNLIEEPVELLAAVLEAGVRGH